MNGLPVIRPILAARLGRRIPESQYREAILWAKSSQGPNNVALSHETALVIYGISDANPSRVHLTVPKAARLRREQPKWIAIHHGDLQPVDVTLHEGLPVTTVSRTVTDILTTSGRADTARHAIADARKEGQISKLEAIRLKRQVERFMRKSLPTAAQKSKEHP